MQNKLQELTEKIYSEGVEKANREASEILAKAKSDAEQIIAIARKEEGQIVEEAKKQAAEIKKNVDSEIQMAAKQAISALKQKISHLVEKACTEPPIKSGFDDKEFIKNIIQIVLNNWNPQKADSFNLKLLLPEKEEKELNTFFNTKAKNYLDGGLEITFEQKIKSGFKIGPKDGSYLISFTDTDFENYFKNYLKPRTIKLLYGE